MTDDRHLSIVLERWLDEGPIEMPDRVVGTVADRIARQSQRPAWRLDWRPHDMNLFFRIGAAIVAVLVVAVAAWVPLAGRDGLFGDSSPGSSATPLPGGESSLGAADLPRIVVSATSVPGRLSVSGTLSGPDALRASELIPDDQSGIVDALLVTLTRASDDSPHAVGHTFEAPAAARFLELNGQYGSLAMVFETDRDAEVAFEAAAARLTAPDGWGLEMETDTSFSSGDWVPEGGVRYFQGHDYGDPIVRAYLWRVDNVLLYGVDFHVYDLRNALRSMVEEMDARARSLAGHR